MNDVPARDSSQPAKPRISSLRHRLADAERRVCKDIDPRDSMLKKSRRGAYHRIGKSTLGFIIPIVESLNIDARSILDFGCGWGRVSRWLKAGFPEAQLQGCDLDRDGIAFVRERIGVPTFESSIRVDEIAPDTTFDVIFAGSVVTHLSADGSRELLDRFHEWLNPNGVMIVTSHGKQVEQWTLAGHYAGKPPEKLYLKAVDECVRTGYGYCDYPHQVGYGVSITRPAWFFDYTAARPNRRIVGFIEHGWNDHQDVVAIQKI